jgi:hypothetical protein
VHSLNKKDKIRKYASWMEEGWYLSIDNTSNVSREGMAHGENLWRMLKSDPRIYGEKFKGWK